MRKQFKTLIFIFFILTFLPFNANASEIIDINYIIEHAKEFDGHLVTIEGEAIGEQLERGDFSWININDGSNAIGIWLKSKDAEKIKIYGDYKHKGDIIRITGVFNRACKEHGGESDIHNKSLVITEKGHIVNEAVSKNKVITAVIMTTLTIILLYFFKKIKN